jgi:integrase
MLAVGCRIGEMLALRWSDLDLGGERPILTVSGTIKTETGMGTYRKATPKSGASRRTVVLPRFAAELLRVRREFATPERERRCLRHPQRHVASGRQRRATVAADPQGHRLRMGHPPHIPQDGGDPDLRGDELGARVASVGSLLEPGHPRPLHRQAPVSADLSELLERLAGSDDASADS